MKLSSLTRLHRREQTERLKQLAENVSRVKALLADEGRLRKVLKEELSAIASKFGESRKTLFLESLKEKLKAPEEAADGQTAQTDEESLSFNSAQRLAFANLNSERALLAHEENAEGSFEEEAVDETECVSTTII